MLQYHTDKKESTNNDHACSQVSTQSNLLVLNGPPGGNLNVPPQTLHPIPPPVGRLGGGIKLLLLALDVESAAGIAAARRPLSVLPTGLLDAVLQPLVHPAQPVGVAAHLPDVAFEGVEVGGGQATVLAGLGQVGIDGRDAAVGLQVQDGGGHDGHEEEGTEGVESSTRCGAGGASSGGVVAVVSGMMRKVIREWTAAAVSSAFLLIVE